MVLGRKTNFFLGKAKNNLFRLSKTILFLGQIGFPLVNYLFPRKTQKHLLRVWPHSVFKDGFFGFSLGKVGF